MNTASLINPASRTGRRRTAAPGRIARRWQCFLVMLVVYPAGGCVTLAVPDRPIVIELNINITQQVIYRLAEDAGTAIDEHADIF